MKPKLLLRIAAVIMLLHAVGHTLGVATWQKPDGDIPAKVVQIMQAEKFGFMGSDGATMAGFYSGFGYCCTAFLVFIAVLLWIISRWKGRPANEILWTVGIAILSLAAIEIVYFFPMAVSFCVVAAALVFLSIFFIRQTD